jgi:hypothetical protein
MRLRSLVAAASAAAALFVPVASAQSAITVDPLVGTPDTAFHVEVPATFPIRQLRDRYWFVLHGPGGRSCDATVTDRVGITPRRSARKVAVDLPGVRVVNSRQIVPGPWCVGKFTGRVEFRDWRPRTHKYVIRRIGTFSVTVEDEQ